jgi:hypothetical protein
MEKKFSNARDELSLRARMFRLGLWAVIQAFRLSPRTGIFVCFRTRKLGSLHDISGWKPKLLCG